VRQALAALAAILLVVAAVLVRSAIDGDGGGSGSGGAIAIACPPELADACRALGGGYDVRVQPAAETADALAVARSAEDAGVDVWLVPRPWAEWVSAERDDAEGADAAGGEAVVGEPSEVIARSPVAIVAYGERAGALESGICGGTLAWRCLGDAADRPWGDVGGQPAWGRVKAGLSDPTTSTGMIVLGGATAGFFESPSYASNDFGGQLAGWLGALGAHADVAGAPEPVTRMITRGPGELSAVGTLEVEARQAAGRDNLRVLYPAPVATADLVAVPVGDAGAAGDVAGDGDLRRALAEDGWRVDGEELAEGVSTDVELPEDDGLPSGSVLRALVARWTEATG
jgi:hypothetical protein